ncbi:restriction endonuclease subunit S [Sphingorhabdus soli]|uniref:Restriction endonuclease subunit S n=1 Tax=Flavisphingopyxis soli TaxID=2601267 RepID=A0A5C6U9N1_9SPHN|nr:restriction endonuclease subunit S [Sphingorhabdus soli]TXC68268.1 restriction endonuclease subunit S [Sphingorhabdus soli]
MSFDIVTPGDWPRSSVSKYCQVQLGKMLQNDPSGEDDELLPYLRAISISKNGVDLSHQFAMWIKPHEKAKYRLRPDDVLVSEGGDAGRTAHFKSEGEYYFQNAINRVRPLNNGQIESRYLFYWFTYLKLAGYVDLICNVATIAHFTAEKVKAAPFALPPLTTQRRIVALLDERTAQIDGLITRKKALLERLAEKRQAIITQAVTKGLKPAAATKDSGIDWLGQIPAHWDALPLRRLADRVVTGRTPPAAAGDFFTDSDVPWYTPGDFEGLFLADAEKSLTADAFSEGYAVQFPANSVLLVGIGATLGKVAVAPMTCSSNQQINAITANGETDPIFLAYSLHAFRAEVRMSASGNTLPILNQEKTKAIIMTRPPYAEQAAIGAFLREQDRKIEAVVEKVETSIKLLVERRSALVTNAVTGQIEGLQ